MRKVICIIPARGGSKSIPLKNIKLFFGKPLIYWTLKAAQNTTYIDKIYVPSDSKKIREMVYDMHFSKVEAINRSAESSKDTASSEQVLIEVAQKADFDDLIFLQATSPFTQAQDITKAYKKYTSQKYDSLFSSVVFQRFLWMQDKKGFKPINYDFKKRPRRQELTPYYVLENGAIYITSKKSLLESKNRLSGRIGTYIMKPESYIELDELKDWEIAEALFSKIT